MKSLCFQITAAILISLPLWADAPVALPERHNVSSSDGKYEAISDPENGTKCIDKLTGKTLWENKKWYRYLFLSNNGRCAVSVYDGYMIPLGYDKKMTLLTFLKDGKIIREVSVGEIISDPKILVRTVSNYEWGEVEGFNEDGIFRLRLNGQKILLFDPETGMRYEGK